MHLQRPQSRGVFEQPYTLNGCVVLVAVDSTSAYVGHELVCAEDDYGLAAERLWRLLDTKDPLQLRLAHGLGAGRG